MGFMAETSLHAMRLIMGGVFEEFPKLTIILGHLGEGLPFWLERIDNRYALFSKADQSGRIKKLKRLPSEYMRRNGAVSTHPQRSSSCPATAS